ISLLPSPHNLHAYDEHGVPWEHVPFPPHADARAVLTDLYARLREWLAHGDRLLLHQEELGDVVVGVLAGYLVYAGLIPAGPPAIAILEELTHRPLGPPGRELVAVAASLHAGA